MKTRTIRIAGMTCVNCQNRIEKALREEAGVAEARVSYAAGTATVSYDPALVSLDRIEEVIEGAGYQVAEGTGEGKPAGQAGGDARRAAGLLFIIIAGAFIAGHFGGGLAFPTAEAGMGLPVMFLLGLVTSVHCLGMCGGINLSQTLKKSLSTISSSILYNSGRVLSYTATGALVGALGSVFTLSGRGRGLVQIAAGVFMLIMGVNMLGIFRLGFLRALSPRLPRFITDRVDGAKLRARSPLLVGLLNGLMPCGPLQAMQLYALSTGSALRGAAAMLLFSLGTVPLMFGLGALGSFLASRPKITRSVMTVGACIVAIMGITMFTQGAALSGLSLAGLFPAQAASAPAEQGARLEGGVQVVRSTLSPGRYPAITVQAGVPVRWTIDAPQGSINGCNNALVIPEYDIQYRFRPGENLIEFTPERTGKFRYSCWMGMIRSTITVVADAAALAAAATEAAPAGPVPAGYTIPTERLAVASIEGRIQRVAITLTDEGFSPAVVVVQAGIETEWIIDNQSIEDGSAEFRVPLYTTILPLEKQAENRIRLLPEEDFDFSTGDSIFFGLVKVVPDISKFDPEAVKKEAAEFETLVYTDDYFQASVGGCCGGG